MDYTCHPYAGYDKERSQTGRAGHCDDCVAIGHVRAHPELGCGDVGCTKHHPADAPEDRELLRWETDKAGDSLYRGAVFLGCIYDRDGMSGGLRRHGWRALAGDDLIPVGDVLPTTEQPDARMGARALLEAHVGATLPLPTAAELLRMTEN